MDQAERKLIEERAAESQTTKHVVRAGLHDESGFKKMAEENKLRIPHDAQSGDASSKMLLCLPKSMQDSNTPLRLGSET